MKFKFLLALMTILGIAKVQASHFLGGQIWYEYIGDSTGIPNQFQVYFEGIRDSQGAIMPSSLNITISSSCYNSQTLTLQRVSTIPNNSTRFGTGFLRNDDHGCPYLFPISFAAHYNTLYTAIVILAGPCNDYNFSFSDCCRSPLISNFKNSSSIDFNLEASLNFSGTDSNSSPIISYFSLKRSCINQPTEIQFYIDDKDGDSIHIAFDQPLHNGAPVNYQTGLSYIQPIPSSTPISLDKNGTLTFTPTQIGVNLIKVKFTEYKKLPNSTYREIGSTSRDWLINVQYCDTSNAPFRTDTLGINSNIVIACNSNVLEIPTGFYYYPYSLADDGSDFLLADSLGNNIPIISAKPFKTSANNSEGIIIELQDSIYYDDKYTLSTRIGSDSNTIHTACGIYLKANEKVSFRVDSCKTKLSIDPEKMHKISIYPVPADDYILIQVNEPSTTLWQLDIYDNTGRIVYYGSKEIDADGLKVPLENFKPGLYHIVIFREGESMKRSFIKK